MKKSEKSNLKGKFPEISNMERLNWGSDSPSLVVTVDAGKDLDYEFVLELSVEETDEQVSFEVFRVSTFRVVKGEEYELIEIMDLEKAALILSAREIEKMIFEFTEEDIEIDRCVLGVEEATVNHDEETIRIRCICGSLFTLHYDRSIPDEITAVYVEFDQLKFREIGVDNFIGIIGESRIDEIMNQIETEERN